MVLLLIRDIIGPPIRLIYRPPIEIVSVLNPPTNGPTLSCSSFSFHSNRKRKYIGVPLKRSESEKLINNQRELLIPGRKVPVPFQSAKDL
jgi:hypothetical protein